MSFLDSEIVAVGRVGKNGELYPPKRIREFVGLRPGQKVLYVAKGDRIEVIPIKDFLEALREDPLVCIGFEEFEELSGEVLPI